MGKKAVLIGCNYAGTQAELQGCITDVKRMYRCLVDRYGFLDEDIKVLIDTKDSCTQPTGRNIFQALIDLVSSAKSGDVLFVHYSGHGVRLPVEASDTDDTGYDECIVPSDFNLIHDHDFRELVEQVPHGCRITIVSDSCHSGGLIHEAKEQIGLSYNVQQEDSGSGFGFTSFLFKIAENVLESCSICLPFGLWQKGLEDEVEEEQEKEVEEVNYTRGPRFKNRSLPLPTLVDILKQKSDKKDIDVVEIGPTVLDIFGESSSPKVKDFKDVRGGDSAFLGMVVNLNREFPLQKLQKDSDDTDPTIETEVEWNEDEYARSQKPELPQNGILISGCQTYETSADATPVRNQAYGALSNAIQKVIEESDGVVSNLELVLQVRRLLKLQGYSQNPGLYCDDNHAHSAFVC
uniref:metacaspase-4-like isoform X2 n=1 Tax=Erigeron canadensis TaxID=72917 RepID=UPI001CB9CBFE|nr:metacaspase-4-like isoform X2 [Erigeron canadensis]